MRQQTDPALTQPQRRLDPASPTDDATAHPVDAGASCEFAVAHGTPATSDGTRPDPSRATRVLKAIGSNLAAIVAFAIPSVALWWHVWSTHPSATLTCPCGDPAQQVWFTAWPAYAITHLHSVVFSHAVNVPDGANLLSNTAGTLVAVVLAPITWAWGPIAATNVALTLAPALSAWACYVALRPLVRWRPGAAVAGLVFGYSAAMISSLSYGHVSLSVLVVPPLLFSLLHEILIRQEHSARRDGLCLAALLVVQFLISPEVLVMCALLAVIGLVPVLLVGWRQVRVRSWHALPALVLGLGLAIVVLAYPIWFGLDGPQAVTGVLFALAPLSGVPLSGVLAAGNYNAPGNLFVQLGGYLGRTGPPADYLGWGAIYSAIAALFLGWRRLLTWLLVLLAIATLWLSLGPFLVGAPSWLFHLWLPWRDIDNLPVIKEILPDQIVPFLSLFVAFLLAVGLDALFTRPVATTAATTAPAPPAPAPPAPAPPTAAESTPPAAAHAATTDATTDHPSHRTKTSWFDAHRTPMTALATAAIGLATLVPLFLTYDMPFRVTQVRLPDYYAKVAPKVPTSTVLLTIPFAVSGEARPMLWQAVDGFQFKLAGAALKTPNANGGPVQHGLPGSARSILTDLTTSSGPQPTGADAELLAVRGALVSWHVNQVVIAGHSLDPIYSSGFFAEALGVQPVFAQGAWVWTLRPGWTSVKPAYGAPLEACRAAAAAPAVAHQPLYMSSCVLSAAGRTPPS